MPSAPAVAGLTQGTFRQMIRDERARELCFEGERKNDLIRWGIYVDAMTNGRTMMVADSRWHVNKKYASAIANYTSERHVLYPIPSSELATNHKMKQSPLW
ncbi:SusD family protein [compost metagenome]